MVLKCKDSGDRVKDSKGLSIYFPTDATTEDLNDYKSLEIKDADWRRFSISIQNGLMRSPSYSRWLNELALRVLSSVMLYRTKSTCLS